MTGQLRSSGLLGEFGMIDLLKAPVADIPDCADNFMRERRVESIQMLLQPSERSGEHDFVELECLPRGCIDLDFATAGRFPMNLGDNRVEVDGSAVDRWPRDLV